jgi:flagellar biosynthesis/type III secretory pathway M-ring protein FliF/YscJ
MSPELFHLIPDLLDWLYHNQPLFFHAVVTFPIAFVLVLFLFFFIREIPRQRRRNRRKRELFAVLQAQPTKAETED